MIHQYGYLVDFFGSDVISEFEKYARLSESISTNKTILNKFLL
jgi:hypothetical protein